MNVKRISAVLCALCICMAGVQKLPVKVAAGSPDPGTNGTDSNGGGSSSAVIADLEIEVDVAEKQVTIKKDGVVVDKTNYTLQFYKKKDTGDDELLGAAFPEEPGSYYVKLRTIDSSPVKGVQKDFEIPLPDPVFTLTIPSSVSLGTMEYPLSLEVTNEGEFGNKKMVITAEGSGTDGSFVLENGDDTLPFTLDAKYGRTENADDSYSFDKIEAVEPNMTLLSTDSDSEVYLDFKEPSSEDVNSCVYAGTYTGTITFHISIEQGEGTP